VSMDIFSDKRILTVSRVTALIRSTLEDNFQMVWVEGEISNLSTPSSGHLYFTLKDAGAQLRCVMFKGAAKNLRFRLKDGMVLILRGRITVYEQRGDYQLIAEYAEPQGVGALQLAFEQLKESLAREGLFDEARKKALPLLPQRIGVITSPTGAAIHDILTVVNRRFANVSILIVPVRVQGDGAGEEVAAAIDDLNSYGCVDVMIVGRGGGSLEDLWAFNEECVARAIARSRIPVISAVGHEVDVTIADFVADLRAATPSAAAELVVQSKQELESLVENLSHRLQREMELLLRHERSEVDRLSHALRDPTFLLGHLAQRLDDQSARLRQAVTGSLGRRKERLVALARHLRLVNPALQVERGRERIITLFARMEMGERRILDGCHEQTAVFSARLNTLSPLETLGRGYAVVRTYPHRRLVRDGADLAPGDRLELVLHRGRALCLVEENPVAISPET
jgi:exodeoxyribonuclease VII large subunit